MLRLALLRHAKSSWDDPGLDDFDRPLNARGRLAAPVIGQMLASLKFSPGVVLCSPSRRTRETLSGIASTFAKPAPEVLFEDALYLASASDLIARVQKLDPGVQRALIIGHNPGLQVLAATLATSGDSGQIARLTEKFPTAGLALFSFDAATFAKMRPDAGHLDAFISPKDRA